MRDRFVLVPHQRGSAPKKSCSSMTISCASASIAFDTWRAYRAR
jgi:hypothetical protein